MTSVFLLAGESSGDRIGARLMAGLKARGHIEFTGVGGDAMIEQGLVSRFPMDDLAVMGYADVLVRLPLLLWRARQVVDAIMRGQPDVVVLIDAQVFSQVVASRLRRKGYGKPIVLYVAPAVWAWKPERAEKISRLYDEVLAVLPFEPEAMARRGGPPTRYVGHPALNRFAMREASSNEGPLLLLPGSRSGELRRHLPVMRELAQRFAGHPAVTEIIIPTPLGQAGRVRAQTSTWTVPVTVVTAEPDRLSALRRAVGAVCVSGTATLELALAGVPHVITYIADSLQTRHYLSAQPSWIGLPNIILDADVVPEVLFSRRAETGRLIEATEALLDDEAMRAAQTAHFLELRRLMEKGAQDAPRVDPVDRIVSYL